MPLVESIVLAVALCVDILVVSTTSSFKSKMPFRRGLLMALVFSVFHGAFPLLGALLGTACQSLVETFDHWIAFVLLVFVGGRMLWEAFHPNDKNEKLDVSRFGVMCLLGVAVSIDAFVTGIGFGFNYTFVDILKTILVLCIVTVITAMVGWFLGRRNIPVPEKVAGVLAGLTLIGLGAYTLLEHTVL